MPLIPIALVGLAGLWGGFTLSGGAKSLTTLAFIVGIFYLLLKMGVI